MDSLDVQDLQNRISGVWGDLLALEEVPLDTHFYDVGGNSLRFVVLLTRLNQLAGREIDPTQLFRCTTVRAQADLLARS
ncbi:phosphopantetheine-binding protein [Streptomyces sp. NPDC056347]|uniref:phosphopantetheine-binding protein n=1 Tax=Streptomyces sp. NPDC056347 TaxID=3345790 RepID=UPI0035D8206D